MLLTTFLAPLLKLRKVVHKMQRLRFHVFLLVIITHQIQILLVHSIKAERIFRIGSQFPT